MMTKGRVLLWMGSGLTLLMSACGGGNGGTTPPVTTYVLTVNSTNPASGAAVTAAPTDNNSQTGGTTSFTLTYNAGTSVTLTATATAGGNAFTSWSGCTSSNTVTCSMTMNASTTVTAAYSTVNLAATVSVNQTNPGPTVTDQLLGMNMAAWYDPTTSGVLAGFQAANIKALRWPGGSWSDDYHWTNNTLCGGTPDANAAFPDFVNDLAIPGQFDVALTANYGTDPTCNGPGEPTEAAAWVANALTLGITVSHMSVGNEEYGSWETDMHPIPHDPATYADAVVGAGGYYALIKASSPNTLVGVDVDADDTSGGWDETVLANAKGSYDFVEYHYYPQAPGNESDTFLVQQAGPELTTNINTIKQELSAAGTPDTPIYVGEMGSVYSNPGKQSMSITQGLYAGQTLGEMMNDGVSRATWWIGYGNCNGTAGNDSSSLYGWQDFGAYNVFSDGPSDSNCTPWSTIGTMSPTARAFELFSNVAVAGESVLTSTVSGDTLDVRAYSATHSGGTALVLFNLNETAAVQVMVTLSTENLSNGVSVITYSKGIYDQTQNGVWAAPTTTNMGAQNLPLTLILAPWSMNVVLIQ